MFMCIYYGSTQVHIMSYKCLYIKQSTVPFLARPLRRRTMEHNAPMASIEPICDSAAKVSMQRIVTISAAILMYTSQSGVVIQWSMFASPNN